MRAADFSFLTNKSFEKKFNHEREPKEQGIPILEIALAKHINFDFSALFFKKFTLS
jgi:hypothetical protein